MDFGLHPDPGDINFIIVVEDFMDIIPMYLVFSHI